MKWMAHDYEEERKYKVNQCKKVARNILAHHKKISIKAIADQKALEKTLLNKAKSMSKLVNVFWKKIDKIILFKHRSVVQERHKAIMDRHLNFMVAQTERYSTQLARRLKE